jgi:hypothetical protein
MRTAPACGTFSPGAPTAINGPTGARMSAICSSADRPEITKPTTPADMPGMGTSSTDFCRWSFSKDRRYRT